MLALHVSRRVGDLFWMAVGLAGFLLLFDSILFVIALLALLVGGGGGGNPYSGIFVFFIFPLAVVAGSALCWLSYEMIRARKEEAGRGRNTTARVPV
ncbi:MAG: hypothetical protein ACM3NQ_03510 [Bacteroidales bacterium]